MYKEFLRTLQIAPLPVALTKSLGGAGFKQIMNSLLRWCALSNKGSGVGPSRCEEVSDCIRHGGMFCRCIWHVSELCFWEEDRWAERGNECKEMIDNKAGWCSPFTVCCDLMRVLLVWEVYKSSPWMLLVPFTKEQRAFFVKHVFGLEKPSWWQSLWGRLPWISHVILSDFSVRFKESLTVLNGLHGLSYLKEKV